jgi:short chain dehydrogenase
MDVSDQASIDTAVTTVLDDQGRIDVVVHNAGHLVLGPSEAFTPDQLAASHDANVVSTQRVNRAVLPHLREHRDGLLVWDGSSSARGGTPPYLAPYCAPADQDPAEVARAIVDLVQRPKGQRPFRVHIDSVAVGAEGRVRRRRPDPLRFLPAHRAR